MLTDYRFWGNVIPAPLFVLLAIVNHAPIFFSIAGIILLLQSALLLYLVWKSSKL